MLIALAVAAVPTLAIASDHDDTPLLKALGRSDSRITDLFAFTRGDNLVLALCLDPAIPTTVSNYTFATDLRVSINVDAKSKVQFNNSTANQLYGGTILHPEKIAPTASFTVTFDKAGEPHLNVAGMPSSALGNIQMFTGLRDDPFIRGPRIGRNVVAIVLEMPLALVTNSRHTLLVWATSHIDDISGPFQDLAGRALRSQFLENDMLNTTDPCEHFSKLGLVPDVSILNPKLPTQFPNGRLLTDDVVDIVGDPRVLANDAPFPSASDVPFLEEFPYLAPPHPATPQGLTASE